MTRRLLDYDNFTATATYHHYDESTDTSIIETVQDTDQIERELDATQSFRNDEEYTKQGMKNDVLHYAHIPTGVLMQWFTQGVNINDNKELFKMVNKPEYAYLKTTTMKHK
jgi:hypothetical protein